MTQSLNTIVGKESPDFSVPLTDGTTVTLSDLLKDHDVVVLNLFATWCGPCEREFPEMQKVYEKYGDKAAFISVSTSELDSMEDISKYKESHGITFPMGFTTDGLAFFIAPSYPTTYVIDRNRVIGFCQTGYFANGDLIEEVITPFMGENYEPTQEALYSFIVLTKDGDFIPGAELILKSDNVAEVLTTESSRRIKKAQHSTSHRILRQSKLRLTACPVITRPKKVLLQRPALFPPGSRFT